MMTPQQRARALADAVLNCKRAGISLDHITASLSPGEMTALADVLAECVVGVPPGREEILRAAHTERTRLDRAKLPVPYRVLVLDSEYRSYVRWRRIAAAEEAGRAA